MIVQDQHDNLQIATLARKNTFASTKQERLSSSRQQQPYDRKVHASLQRLLLLVLIFLVTDHALYQSGRSIFATASDDFYGGDDKAMDWSNATDDNSADDAVENDGAAQDQDDEEDEAQGDDKFGFAQNGFGSVSVMPTSCITYNNGHMIKFDFFESSNGQCRLNLIGTFVVSIAHYMRAYFNNQALTLGKDFSLPGDAGFLNCIMLQETSYSNNNLYAKIGCMDRETFTSTKLQLHVYTDAQCSVRYYDGDTNKQHSSRGYEINGYYFSSRVSFRPPFYSCLSCIENDVSDTFNKQNSNWYDDDYISEHGRKKYNNNNDGADDEGQSEEEEEEEVEEQDDFYTDDFYTDDTYMYANDDVNGRRELKVLSAAPGQLEAFEAEFWHGINQRKRSLYDNLYDIGDWNICQRIFKYGVWCDEECQSLDSFRVDEWSKADIFLLGIMCTFMAAMMLLVVVKRAKAAQKARLYGDDDKYRPGLPPLAMAVIFLLIMGIIGALAVFKFVNETLVFAVVTCILLFIYMLKLTLFESRRPVLLAAPRHDLFDNPLDDRLFA